MTRSNKIGGRVALFIKTEIYDKMSTVVDNIMEKLQSRH